MTYVTDEELASLKSMLSRSSLRELLRLTLVINSTPELLVTKIQRQYYEAGATYYDSFCAAFEVIEFLHKYTKPFKETINVQS